MDIAQLLAYGARIAPHIPLRLGYQVCDQLGAVVGPHLPAWRRVLANLSVVLPAVSDTERQRLARGVFAGIFKNYFDLFRYHTLSDDALLRTLVTDGAEHVTCALAKGRGVILVGPHCGNYTIGFAPMIRHFNTRALLVVEQMSDPRVHELMNNVRRMPGIDVEPLSPTIGRSVLQALRRNHIVVLAGDRSLTENTVMVRFFGHHTLLPSGPATLALRTRAALIPLFCNRLPDNRSWIRFDPPLQLADSEGHQPDVRDVTQKIAYIMQAYIRRDPSQWLVAETVWPSA